MVRALFRVLENPYRSRCALWRRRHDRSCATLAVRLGSVRADLAIAVYPSSRLMAPFFDFVASCGARDLRHGHVEAACLEQLRAGEAATSSGMSRAVDASLDRVQVKLSGANAGDYVLLCNGRRVPLQPAGAEGEQVAGVRYRARLFSSVLHSTIGVHAPLVFDIVDTQSQRSIGGCAYHVADPGGAAYDHLPDNPAEAQARRNARFIPHGPGTARAGETRPPLRKRRQVISTAARQP